MDFKSIFRPKHALTEREITNGLRMLTWEGTVSNGYLSITTSGFLAAYALALGANNFQIGVLAALPFIMQLLQIPTVLLVEKVRRRKVIAVFSAIMAQALWIPVALVPLFIQTPGSKPVTALLILIAIRFAFNAVTNCSWSSWVRDLVPQQILGKFYSRRLAFATLVASIYGLGAAFFVDFWKLYSGSGNNIFGYTWVLLFGAVFLAMLSPYFLSRMPEPMMQAADTGKESIFKKLLLPLKDANFRKFIQFLLFWGLSLNLVVPFFAVYMLQRLQMPLLSVISLSVLSQVFNIMFLGVWGRFSDRFGSKVILSLCASLYILVIFGWIFTATPDRHFLTIPLLIILHMFFGIAASGATLTVGTLGMKLAPQGQATSYLTAALLATNIGAGLGPVFGGLLAKFFTQKVFTLDLNWFDAGRHIHLGVLNLTGFSFLFVIAFIFGLFTINLLTPVKEKGEVDREVVLEELMTQSKDSTESTSPFLGITNMFPFSILHKVPGFDVAIGVTVYQLSETTKQIAQKAAQSWNFQVQIARDLEKKLTRLWKNKKEMPMRTIEYAQQATHGAMEAALESHHETARLVYPTFIGIVNALIKSKADPEDSVRGASQGIMKKTIESGGDYFKTVSETIQAVKEIARKYKIDERKLIVTAVQAMLAESRKTDISVERQIRKAIIKVLLVWYDELDAALENIR